MSVTLDSSLITFDEKVSLNIEKMTLTIKEINSKIEEIKSCSKSASTTLNECYSGDGLNSAMTYFNAINTYADTVSSSIEEKLNTSITKSNDLLLKIKALKELEEEINNKEKELSGLGSIRSIPNDGLDHSADISHNNKINSLKNEIEDLKVDFINKETEAKELLNSIMKVDEVIEKEEDKEAGTDYMGISLDDLKGLTPGSYTEHSFTGTNGKTIKYWIYVPENINETTGLPVTMYMCGGEERGDKVNNNSLPMYIKNGTVKPQGIVITLRTETNEEYTNKTYLTTAKELCDNVVQTYNADTNKISLSGHSNGGKGVLALASRYPDYFSTVVPVCGFTNGISVAVDSGTSEEVIKNLKTTHVVGLGGSGDQTSCSSMNNLIKLLQNGGNASLEVVKGYGHTNIYHKYYEPVTIDGKDYSSLLEYLFTYSKA